MPCRKGMTESDRGAKMASMSPARVRAPAIMTHVSRSHLRHDIGCLTLHFRSDKSRTCTTKSATSVRMESSMDGGHLTPFPLNLRPSHVPRDRETLPFLPSRTPLTSQSGRLRMLGQAY